MSAIVPQEVRQACLLLYGHGTGGDPGFLCALTTDELKRHYRSRAKLCHPDRARQLGRHEAQLAVEFRRLDHSYRCLRSFLVGRPHPLRGAAPRRQAPPRRQGQRGASAAPPSDAPGPGSRARTQSRRRSSAGDGASRPDPSTSSRPADGGHRPASGTASAGAATLPDRRLLLAEYLYHRGAITRSQMLAAVVWQRRQRPMIGQLAIDWGYLRPETVTEVLGRCASGERFGACARRLGYLSIFQHYALLGRQKMLQRRIGDYFREHRLLDAYTLEALARAQQEHNRSHWFTPPL